MLSARKGIFYLFNVLKQTRSP